MPVAKVEKVERDKVENTPCDEEAIVGALLAALDKPMFLRELHALAVGLTRAKLSMDDTRDMLIDSDAVVYCREHGEEEMVFPKTNDELVAEALPPIPENSPYGQLLARHEARFGK